MTRRGTHKPETPNLHQKEARRRGGREGGWEEGKAVELESLSGKIPGPLHTAEIHGVYFSLLSVVTLCYMQRHPRQVLGCG